MIRANLNFLFPFSGEKDSEWFLPFYAFCIVRHAKVCVWTLTPRLRAAQCRLYQNRIMYILYGLFTLEINVRDFSSRSSRSMQNSRFFRDVSSERTHTHTYTPIDIAREESYLPQTPRQTGKKKVKKQVKQQRFSPLTFLKERVVKRAVIARRTTLLVPFDYLSSEESCASGQPPGLRFAVWWGGTAEEERMRPTGVTYPILNQSIIL